MNVQRAYKLQTVDVQLLPGTGTPTSAILTLYRNGTLAWATDYPNAQPLPDVGRYVFDETTTDAEGGAFTTTDANGNPVGTGVMNADVCVFTAGGEVWTLTRLESF